MRSHFIAPIATNNLSRPFKIVYTWMDKEVISNFEDKFSLESYSIAPIAINKCVTHFELNETLLAHA